MSCDCRAEVFHWQPISEDLAIFRLKPLTHQSFPSYFAGQNLELVFEEQESRIYSIVSAPQETKQYGYVEFFAKIEHPMTQGAIVKHSDRAQGDFTLQRAVGFAKVLFIGTGTGVAPFVSMLRELQTLPPNGVQYTLIHGSRKFEELGYYKELSALASATKLNFLYIPTVSRPAGADWELTSLGKGRAGALLRRMLHLPQEDEAVLPASLTGDDLDQRFLTQSTIIMACGSHAAVEDVRKVAFETGIRFEKEDW